MYRLITYKKLAFFSGLLCFVMIFSAVANTFSPIFATLSKNEIELYIVMYHQVSENKSLWGDYVIPEKLLRADFEYIKENGFTPISFSTLYDFVSGTGALPKKPIILTFDDGQRSFLTKVLPALEEFQFPANINIVGSLTDLYSENGETNDRYAYLNWNDVRTLSENSLVEIGHHSYNMHSLTSRRGMGKINGEDDGEYLKLIEADIDTLNKKMLEKINERPLIFAYPYGIRNDVLFETIKQRGFLVTLTCRECVNKISAGCDLYELGRFNRPYGKSSNTFFSTILLNG